MIKIKNWKNYQHFKNRTPPWIKLYREILDDPQWHGLDGECAKTLVMLWLIASEDKTHQGLLQEEKKLAFRLRLSESKLRQQLSKLSHWLIQDDIKMISSRYQHDIPETQTQTQTETEKERDTKREKTKESPLTALQLENQFLEKLRANPAYTHIDLSRELAKMDAWLMSRPGRRKTKRFVVNWLNKIDPGLPQSVPARPAAASRMEKDTENVFTLIEAKKKEIELEEKAKAQ